MRTYDFPDGKFLRLGRRALIMGILNLTPDSFWDGGKYNALDAALDRANRLIAAGADIIDVGAESTRPGATPVSAAEEISRLMPFLEKFIPRSPVPVSVDTYKAATAEAAAGAGAHIINDVWGLQYAAEPQKMAEVAAKYNLPVVVTHNRLNFYSDRDIIDEIRDFFRRSLQIADLANLSRDNIILDPGLGFGKDTSTNLLILNRLAELAEIDGKKYPLLLGASRKRFIGETLHLPPEERLEATGAVCLWGVAAGCNILRVHDAEPIARMCRMWEAVRECSADVCRNDAPTKAGGEKTDRIELQGLEFYGYHGCLPDENALGQCFSVDLTLRLDLSAAGKSDSLADTVNYAAVVETVREVVEGKPKKLIECVAEAIAERLLSDFSLINSLVVTVHKSDAPLETKFLDVAVTIERKRA